MPALFASARLDRSDPGPWVLRLAVESSDGTDFAELGHRRRRRAAPPVSIRLVASPLCPQRTRTACPIFGKLEVHAFKAPIGAIELATGNAGDNIGGSRRDANHAHEEQANINGADAQEYPLLAL